MSAYPPPSENLPIFDSGLFGNNTDITIDNLKSKFLTFPLAQSGLETIPNLAITSSGSAPTASSSSNDTTIATTAFVKANALSPLSPVPTGTYTTPSSVVVNQYGQITSATNGTTYSLPSPAPTAGSYTNSNITINSAGQITSASSGTSYTPSTYSASFSGISCSSSTSGYKDITAYFTGGLPPPNKKYLVVGCVSTSFSGVQNAGFAWSVAGWTAGGTIVVWNSQTTGTTSATAIFTNCNWNLSYFLNSGSFTSSIDTIYLVITTGGSAGYVISGNLTFIALS
jgi:hypothetical protein